MGLGDAIENALAHVGITEERVSNWLGKPCGCKARRDKLNQLGTWARGLIAGEAEKSAAAEQLESILQSEPAAESTAPKQLPPKNPTNPRAAVEPAICSHRRPVSTVFIDRSVQPFVVTLKVLCGNCGLPFTFDGHSSLSVPIVAPSSGSGSE